MIQFGVLVAFLGVVSCGPLGTEYLPPTSLPQSAPYQYRAQSPYVSDSPPVPILRLEVDNHGDGNYRYAYQSADGTTVEEEGGLKNGGTELETNGVRGSFSFIGSDGVHYSVSYVADENGFQPQGAHLPTPPPIPEEIQRSLQENAAAANDNDDGRYHQEPQKYYHHHPSNQIASQVQGSYLPPSRPKPVYSSYRLQDGYKY